MTSKHKKILAAVIVVVMLVAGVTVMVAANSSRGSSEVVTVGDGTSGPDNDATEKSGRGPDKKRTTTTLTLGKGTTSTTDDDGGTTTTAPAPSTTATAPSTTQSPRPAPTTTQATPPPPPTTQTPPPPPPPPPPTTTTVPAGVTRDTAAEAAYLTKLNARRASAGKPALSRVGCLDTVAVGWAAHLAQVRQLSHNPVFADQTGQSCGTWYGVAENVGYASTVDLLDNAFWNSPGHKANIVGDYNKVGIGVYRSAGNLWITVNFMKD